MNISMNAIASPGHRYLAVCPHGFQSADTAFNAILGALDYGQPGLLTLYYYKEEAIPTVTMTGGVEYDDDYRFEEKAQFKITPEQYDLVMNLAECIESALTHLSDEYDYGVFSEFGTVIEHNLNKANEAAVKIDG